MKEAPKNATANTPAAEQAFARAARRAEANIHEDTAAVVQTYLLQHPSISDEAEIARLTEIVELALRLERGLG